jgi:hypothetical protein
MVVRLRKHTSVVTVLVNLRRPDQCAYAGMNRANPKLGCSGKVEKAPVTRIQ